MIKRRALRPNNIKVLVLDEADEMLGRGFKEQIYTPHLLTFPQRPH